jgi:glycosyltransferase involved in cell wall biosynthesis
MDVSPRRVTVIAHEFRGIRPCGGMGTATTFLALALARTGHSVEMLLGRDTPPSLDAYWENIYERAGVSLRRAPRGECEPWYFVDSHSIELGLRESPPDVVIAHDFGAPAYTALRSRQAGIAFDDTLFVVFCHGTRRYVMDVSPNLAPKDLRNLLGMAAHEQAAVELADVVVSPSAYLVDWMHEQGWQLPERTLVIPYLTAAAATGERASRRAWSESERLDRLSFFGRVDEKKGVRPLAAALNALEADLLDGLQLEFVGKTTSTWPKERVCALLSSATTRALSISFQIELDQHEALALLSRPGTLAMMPSLQENSPNAVYECLEHGIPFIASHVGGIPELIAPEDHARVLFEPTAAGVEAALRRVLANRHVPRPARPAFSARDSLERWAELIELTPDSHAGEHRREAVDVAVVDPNDSSSIRNDSAPFVLLLGKEDDPEPELVELLLQAQARTGADVVSCGLRIDSDDGAETLHFFSGDAGGLGALSNVYGTVALIRRALLSGHQLPWRADGDPAWPLLAGLVAAGARIVSIPAPLVTSRTPPGSIEGNPSDALLVAQQLERVLGEPLRTTGRLVAGLASAR